MDRPQSDKRYHLTSWQTLRKQNNSLGIRSARLNLTSGKRDLPKKIALTHFFFKLKYNWFILLCKFQVHTAKEFYIYVYIHIHIHTHIYKHCSNIYRVSLYFFSNIKIVLKNSSICSGIFWDCIIVPVCKRFLWHY